MWAAGSRQNSVTGALRASPDVDWRLFELTIETAALRRHGPAGALPFAVSPLVPPFGRTWRAPRALRPALAVAS